MQDESIEQQVAAPSGPIRGQAPGLAGVKGRMLVTVAGAPLGVLQVDDGQVEFVPGGGTAEATVAFEDRADVVRLLQGELNPVVAALQGRMSAGGDVALATRVILGLRPGFSGQGLTKEG
jgi:hypothetical protein